MTTQDDTTQAAAGDDPATSKATAKAEAAIDKAQTAAERAIEAQRKADELAAEAWPGTVNVTLAHPLSKEQLASVGVEVDSDLGPGDRVRVPRSLARSIVVAGYATTDPEDPAAVARLLGGQAAVTTKAEPSATSGN